MAPELKVRAVDISGNDPIDERPQDTEGTVEADAPAVNAKSGFGVAVPLDLFPTLATASTSATTTSGTATGALQGARDGASRKGRLDDDRTQDGDAGSDLAAQLALASQWTGVAQPVAATPQGAAVNTAVAATATAVTAASQGGFDVKSLPGKDRTTPGKDDAAQARRLPITADAGATTAAPTPSTDTSSGDTRQRDDRAPTGNPLVVAAKDDDAKTRSDVALAALDAASLAGAGTTTQVDTTANGDAFALRLAAHVSNVGGATGATSTKAAASASSASSSPAAFAFVKEPVGSPAWSHEVGQATLRMAANDLQSASIRLNPEHLGPLDVQVRVDNGVAHLAFSATHVDTRQALEASRGTLDQLFTSQGLKMGDVSVGAGSSGGSNDASTARGDASADASRRDGGNRWSGDDAGSAGDATVTTVTSRIARALGLVDTFA